MRQCAAGLKAVLIDAAWMEPRERCVQRGDARQQMAFERAVTPGEDALVEPELKQALRRQLLRCVGIDRLGSGCGDEVRPTDLGKARRYCTGGSTRLVLVVLG